MYKSVPPLVVANCRSSLPAASKFMLSAPKGDSGSNHDSSSEVQFETTSPPPPPHWRLHSMLLRSQCHTFKSDFMHVVSHGLTWSHKRMLSLSYDHFRERQAWVVWGGTEVRSTIQDRQRPRAIRKPSTPCCSNTSPIFTCASSVICPFSSMVGRCCAFCCSEAGGGAING